MAKSRRPNLELSVEKILPSTATEWLEFNTFNRGVSERLVDIYAEAMSAGEWILNGEPIIFGTDGRLQSGQHRLLAVVESGVCIESVVVRGAEPDAIYSLDSGRKRRMGDVLALRGEEHVTALGAALSWVWRFKTDNMDRPGETATTTHLLRILDETPEIRESIPVGKRVTRATKLAPGLMGALHWASVRIDPEQATDFWERVIDGQDLKAMDARLVLRKWAFNATNSARRPSQFNVAANTIKAWNAYREIRPIKFLAYKPNEEFPRMV